MADGLPDAGTSEEIPWYTRLIMSCICYLELPLLLQTIVLRLVPKLNDDSAKATVGKKDIGIVSVSVSAPSTCSMKPLERAFRFFLIWKTVNYFSHLFQGSLVVRAEKIELIRTDLQVVCKRWRQTSPKNRLGRSDKRVRRWGAAPQDGLLGGNFRKTKNLS